MKEAPTAPPPNTPLKIFEKLLDHPDYKHLREPDSFAMEIGGLHSPLLLPDMELAVSFLKHAMDKRLPVLVLGDRDVDGVSSTALLGGFLKQHHATDALTLHVSDGGDDYGLTGKIFETIKRSGAHLVVLLDMGSSNGPEIAELLELGMRVIVLDHHQLSERAPGGANCAFVNPVRLDIPLEHDGKIATVGLVFKFLLAYALSHTKDWRTAWYLPLEGSAGEGCLYRCGHYLGKFPAPEAAQNFLQEEFSDPMTLKILDETSDWALDDTELSRLLANPRDAGKVVLSHQIRKRARLAEFVRETSDLAAIGLMTDLVPLVGENRALVRLGMGRSGFEGSRNFRCGLDALMRILNLPQGSLGSRDLGWSIGPALNAAGRMRNTALALRLLLASDETEARLAAKDLVRLNEDRKKRTARNQEIVELHFKQFPEKTEAPLIFCYHSDLEPGVSGIVAARLADLYKKPVFYLNPEGDYARGSARTYNNINVLRVLDAVSHLFIQYGGHKEAAGFSVARDQIDELESCLLKVAPELCVSPADAAAELGFHLELNPAELSRSACIELHFMEPFGPGNPEPVILVRNVSPLKIKFLSGGKHVKFGLRDAPVELECVVWQRGEELREALEGGVSFDFYGCLELNFFRGRFTPQFRVESLVAVS